MSFVLVCPNCGPREVYEFSYGGQIVDTEPGKTLSNQPGPQCERWYHRLGCRRWLAVERDVRTNMVLATAWLRGEGGRP